MKEVIKKSTLAIILLMTTLSYSNVADSIIINDTEYSNIVKIEKLEAGSLLKIIDEFGMTLHKEEINDSEYYSKNFDLSMLPDATYYFELDNENEIRIIPVVIEDQKAMRLDSEETRIAKPNISVDGQMVQIQQNSENKQDLSVAFYYEGKEVAFEESLKGIKNINRSYDFSGSLSGYYTLVIHTAGKTFTDRFNIETTN